MVCVQQRRNSWVLKTRRTSFEPFQDAGRTAPFSLARRSMNRPLNAPEVVEVVPPAQEVEYQQREDRQAQTQQAGSRSSRTWWGSKFRLPNIGLGNTSRRRNSIAGVQTAQSFAFNGSRRSLDIPYSSHGGTWIRASQPTESYHTAGPSSYGRPAQLYPEARTEVYPVAGFGASPHPPRASIDGGWGGRPQRPVRTGSLDFWSSAMALAGYGPGGQIGRSVMDGREMHGTEDFAGLRRGRDLSADYNNSYAESSPFVRGARMRASSASSFQYHVPNDRSVPVQIEGRGSLSSRRPSSAYNWSPMRRQSSNRSPEDCAWEGGKGWKAYGMVDSQQNGLGQSYGPEYFEMDWEEQSLDAGSQSRGQSKERRRGLLVTEHMHARMGFDGHTDTTGSVHPESYRQSDAAFSMRSEHEAALQFRNGRENHMLDSDRHQSSLEDLMDYQDILQMPRCSGANDAGETGESDVHCATDQHAEHVHQNIHYSNIHYDDVWNVHPSQYHLLPRPPTNHLVTDTAIYHRSLFFEQFVLHDESQSDDQELLESPKQQSSDAELHYEEYDSEIDGGLPPPSEHPSDSDADLDYPTTIRSFSERSCDDGIGAEYEDKEESEVGNTVKRWLDELEERGAYRRKECSYRIACQRAFMKQMKDKMQASKLAFDRLKAGLGPDLTEKVLALRRKFGGRRRTKMQEKMKQIEEAELQDIWDAPMLDEEYESDSSWVTASTQASCAV